jgi:hypothetical protein
MALPRNYIPVKGTDHGLPVSHSEGPPARERLHGTRILSDKGAIELKDFHEAHQSLVTRTPIGEIGGGSLIITASLSENSRKYEAGKFQA